MFTKFVCFPWWWSCALEMASYQLSTQCVHYTLCAQASTHASQPNVFHMIRSNQQLLWWKMRTNPSQMISKIIAPRYMVEYRRAIVPFYYYFRSIKFICIYSPNQKQCKPLLLFHHPHEIMCNESTAFVWLSNYVFRSYSLSVCVSFVNYQQQQHGPQRRRPRPWPLRQQQKWQNINFNATMSKKMPSKWKTIRWTLRKIIINKRFSRFALYEYK